MVSKSLCFSSYRFIQLFSTLLMDKLRCHTAHCQKLYLPIVIISVSETIAKGCHSQNQLWLPQPSIFFPRALPYNKVFNCVGEVTPPTRIKQTNSQTYDIIKVYTNKMTMVVNHNNVVYRISIIYSTIKCSMTKISVRL